MSYRETVPYFDFKSLDLVFVDSALLGLTLAQLIYDVLMQGCKPTLLYHCVPAVAGNLHHQLARIQGEQSGSKFRQPSGHPSGEWCGSPSNRSSMLYTKKKTASRSNQIDHRQGHYGVLNHAGSHTRDGLDSWQFGQTMLCFRL